MAETIGTAASIAGFIALAGQVVDGSKKLYNFYTNIKDGPKNIQKLTAEMKAVESISQQILLQSKKVEEFTEQSTILPILLEEAKQRIDRLFKILEEYKPKHDWSQTKVLWTNIKYAFKNEGIEKHLYDVYRVKSLLTDVRSNINSAVQLEVRDLAKTTVDSVKTLQQGQNTSLAVLTSIQCAIQKMNPIITQPQNKLLEINKEQRVIENYSYTPKIISSRSELPVINDTYPLHSKVNASSKLALEEFAGNQFQFLVVCIFLNKTSEASGIPKARELFLRYPTPEILAVANADEIKPYFKGLGLPTRAQRLIEFAKAWLETPPEINKLRGKRGQKRDDVSEVSHLPGIGLFASDCWRVFCKDQFYKTAGRCLPQAEWKRVVPNNPKLKDYLKSRWANEGFIWNPDDGSLREQLQEIGSLGKDMNNLRIQ